MEARGEPCQPGPNIQPLLNASKYFLCHRNFTESRKHATKAQLANPNHPGPPQLIAITAVLSTVPSTIRPEPPDWYSILDLPRFTHDRNLIRTRFDCLTKLLNPEKNPYPFAAEAHEWVSKAGSVLSNPNVKAQLDKVPRMKGKDTKNGGGTFWTLCPYCYYMYEYQKMYEECVLRCQNVKCRRGFTAVAVADSAAPPPEVVVKGQYFCYGFSPLGPKNENDEGEGRKWWAPFVFMGSGRINENKEGVRMNDGSKSENVDDFIEISDDESEGEEEVKKRVALNGDYDKIVAMKRRKIAATCKKKLMGRGIKLKGDHSSSKDCGEGKELKVEVNENNANTSGVTDGCNGNGLEFSAGEDDIFVALNTMTDMGSEEFGA